MDFCPIVASEAGIRRHCVSGQRFNHCIISTLKCEDVILSGIHILYSILFRAGVVRVEIM